jgi:hypothetical protein
MVSLPERPLWFQAGVVTHAAWVRHVVHTRRRRMPPRMGALGNATVAAKKTLDCAKTWAIIRVARGSFPPCVVEGASRRRFSLDPQELWAVVRRRLTSSRRGMVVHEVDATTWSFAMRIRFPRSGSLPWRAPRTCGPSFKPSCVALATRCFGTDGYQAGSSILSGEHSPLRERRPRFH